MNKKIIIGISMFLGGISGSGLFAIGQAVSNIVKMMGGKQQNICGVLCFCCLIVFVVGLGLLVKELFQKDK